MSKGAETRGRIVAEAATLFNQHGFAGGSMAELMKATALEKGGILPPLLQQRGNGGGSV